jgi:hypothetical protein
MDPCLYRGSCLWEHEGAFVSFPGPFENLVKTVLFIGVLVGKLGGS